MLHIKFKYKDEYTNGEWAYQECVVESVKECKEIYGLDYCEYEILEVRKENE